jgi:hypothetical protein
MVNIQNLLIDACLAETREGFRFIFGEFDEKCVSTAEYVGRLALENISDSSALYHNLEHTIMVNSAGNAILKGKHLRYGGITPEGWLNFMIATYCHDIGYVHGICRKDGDDVFATGLEDETVEVRRGGSDAQLAPWHVDRSKSFVRERFGDSDFIDTDQVCDMIESTRFPVEEDEVEKEDEDFCTLVRAADLIGQLGDPRYLHKIPALYYEFMESGSLEVMGYENPEQMRKEYADFYRKMIYPHIRGALDILRVTEEGRQWASILFSHVVNVEQLNTPK